MPCSLDCNIPYDIVHYSMVRVGISDNKPEPFSTSLIVRKFDDQPCNLQVNARTSTVGPFLFLSMFDRLP